jgi:hypothetical protein
MGADDEREVDRSNMGEGRYANYAEIGQNASEFIFDFGQVWVDAGPAYVYVRVITTPETAQRILVALEDALSGYRRVFGDVGPDEQPGSGGTP